MVGDALSPALRSLRLTGGLFFRVRARAPFSIRSLPAPAIRARYAGRAAHVLPFHVVTAGSVWFRIDGAAPVRLGPDEVIVFPHGTEHALSDDPERSPIAVERLEHLIEGRPPTLVYGGPGPGSEALCGFFAASVGPVEELVSGLPQVVVLRARSERAPWIAATFRRAFADMGSDRPGRSAMAERLTESLFVDVLQALSEDGPPPGSVDPLVARALDAIHRAPEHPWTVDALARLASSSRSVLADRFHQAVGMSPMRYLTCYRMERAAETLLGTRATVAQVAAEAGYSSETAFGRAFKRHTGRPPASWRRELAPSKK